MADPPLFSDALPDLAEVRRQERLRTLHDILPWIEAASTMDAAVAGIRIGIMSLEQHAPQGQEKSS